MWIYEVTLQTPAGTFTRKVRSAKASGLEAAVRQTGLSTFTIVAYRRVTRVCA